MKEHRMSDEAQDLIGLTKDDLLKQLGKPLAKDRFTLSTVEADQAASAKGDGKEVNPLRLKLMAEHGPASDKATIPDTYTEVTEFHWKDETSETYTSVWMLKHKTVWTAFEATKWQAEGDLEV